MGHLSLKTPHAVLCKKWTVTMRPFFFWKMMAGSLQHDSSPMNLNSWYVFFLLFVDGDRISPDCGLSQSNVVDIITEGKGQTNIHRNIWMTLKHRLYCICLLWMFLIWQLFKNKWLFRCLIESNWYDEAGFYYLIGSENVLCLKGSFRLCPLWITFS